MKSIAMHITYQKLSFDRKFTKYVHGTWFLLNILMIFGIKKINIFDPYNVFLAIATNIPMTGLWYISIYIYIYTK